MKALALVVSARERGNCYDFAEFMLERLKQQRVEGELINFYDCQITPCQRCSYECVLALIHSAKQMRPARLRTMCK